MFFLRYRVRWRALFIKASGFSFFFLWYQSTVFWDASRSRSWSCGPQREANTKILWCTRLCVCFSLFGFHLTKVLQNCLHDSNEIIPFSMLQVCILHSYFKSLIPMWPLRLWPHYCMKGPKSSMRQVLIT